MASSHYCARCLTTFAGDPDECPNLSCGGPRPKAGWGTLLGAGDLLDRTYRIAKPLAVGGAGLTYLAQEVDGEGNPQPPDLAIKVLYTARDSGPFLRRLSNEAQILQELAHAHIVECRGFVHRTGHAPYLVTLFEHGGSLSSHVERVGRLSPDIAAGIVRQVLLALDVAHQRGVVHRDLKPDNVLLHEKVERDVLPYVRVTDFGIAKVFGGVGGRLTKVGSFIGTPEYASPEQFEGTAPTPATDVFAAGGMLFYLLTGAPPVKFTHRMDIEHCYGELLDQLPPRIPEFVTPPEAREMLQRVLANMMMPNQGDRWTIQQTLAELAPLLRGGFTSQLVPGEIAPGKKGEATDTLQRNTLLTREKEKSTLQSVDTEGRVKGAPASAASEVAPPPPPPLPDGAERPTPPPPTDATARAPDVADDRPPPLPPEPPKVPPEPPKVPPEPPKAAPQPPKTAPEPLTPAPEVPPAPAREAPAPPRARKRGGGGLLGMGAVAALLVVGGGVAILALVGGAWAMGWFSPAPATADTTAPVLLDPVAVIPTEPVELTGATDAFRTADRRGIEEALSKAAPDIAKFCDPRGKVPVELVIEADGRIRSAVVDPRKVKKPEDATCVQTALMRMTVPRKLGEPATLRTTITF